MEGEVKKGIISEVWSKRGYILKAFGVLAFFALLQLANQYLFVPYKSLPDILIRGFALGGATLVGLSALVGPLAVLFPKYNYVAHRRAIGVSGFVLIYLHFFFIFSQRLKFSTEFIFNSLNPFINGLFVGFLAYVPLVLLFLTSTDWATRKLGQRNWKNLHRLIYISFLLYILHAVIMTENDPVRILNPAGFLLILVTILTAILQLFAFLKRIRAGNSKPLALYVGSAFIIAYLAILGTFFLARGILTGK